MEAKYAVLLEYLAKNGDTLVTREQLIKDVWQDRHVEYRTVNSAISRLRRILGGDRDDFIKTHPKLGYSMNCRVEFLGEPVPTKKENTTSLNKFKYTLIAFCILLCILLLQFSILKPERAKLDQTTPLPVLTEKEVSVKSLTYMKGWEYTPSISNNKSLLAFTHLSKKKGLYQVVIQNLKNQKTRAVEPASNTSSPFWSPQSNELFYKSFKDKQCLIKKVYVQTNLTITDPEVVTSCGRVNYLADFTKIVVSSDMNWLYYNYSETASTPRVIRRYHLKNHQTQTITAPSMKFLGETNLSLSPDNKKLAFMREQDDFSVEIMMLNLDSGELTSILKSSYLPYSLDWSKSGTHLLYINENVDTLNAIDIKTHEVTSLFQYSQQIMDQVMISNNELLLSFGDLHTANIKQIDLTKPELPISDLISSSFKDHSAAIYESNGQERIAFVSNRSGNYQIWLKEKEHLQQLTKFKGRPYLEDMTFSANGESLLFLQDRKLHVLDIKNKLVKPITHPTKLVKNFIWQCNSDENIFIIAKESDIWGLYQVNTSTQATKLLTTGITSIHSVCKSDKSNNTNPSSSYYVSNIADKGIFQLTSDWTINKKKHYLANATDIDFYDNRMWAATEKAIYYISEGEKIFQFDISTRQSREINFLNVDTYFLSIQNNKLILNDLQLADTFIGKITLPGLSERLLINNL
ncbi:winged helix-turn-helix domain-containing protein [Thalassomonas viridans]|uniref:winged helix-turn-helix domain-containing protein n=1 Tax=Thalassomonas viridans TaxID=137584 RepID=UPI0022A94E4D|nr:winged helix-turn-helix domain-containing protein [Thalassomonas viridans]